MNSSWQGSIDSERGKAHSWKEAETWDNFKKARELFNVLREAGL